MNLSQHSGGSITFGLKERRSRLREDVTRHQAEEARVDQKGHSLAHVGIQELKAVLGHALLLPGGV